MLTLEQINADNAHEITEVEQDMPMGRGRVYDAAWSKDGSTIAIGSASGVWFYKADQPAKAVRTLPVNGGVVWHVAFTKDDLFVVAMVSTGRGKQNHRVLLWDYPTGELVQTLFAFEPYFEMSPDSANIIYVSENQAAQIWNVEKQRSLFSFPSAGFPYALSPDNRLLVIGQFTGRRKNPIHKLKVIDTATRKLVKTLPNEPLKPYSYRSSELPYISEAVFAVDGKTLVTGQTDGQFSVWDTQTWTLQHTANALLSRGDVMIQFSPAGDFVVVISNNGLYEGFYKIELRETTTYSVIANLPSDLMLSPPYAAVSPDSSRIVFSDGNNGILIWNVKDSKVEAIVGGKTRQTAHAGDIKSIGFSPDGNTLALVQGVYSLQLWDVQEQAYRASLMYSNWAKRIAFSPDSRLLVGGADGANIGVWDVQTGEQITKWAGAGGLVSCADFKPDGTLFAIGDWSGVVGLWDANTFEERFHLRHGGKVWDVAFSPDNMLLASGGGDEVKTPKVHNIRLWNAHDGTLRTALRGHSVPVLRLVFSANSALLASMAVSLNPLDERAEVIVWDAVSGKALVRVDTVSEVMFDIALHPEGTLLAVASGDTVRLVDTKTGDEQHTINLPNENFHTTGHTLHPNTIAFNEDGSLLAVGAFDGHIYLCESKTGRFLNRMLGDPVGVNAVAFNADSTMLAAAGWSGIVTLWGVPK